MADATTPQASALPQERFWTFDRIADALGEGPRGTTELSRISTDTRHVEQGSCFLALQGETFDALDYLGEAVAKGAAALIVRDARRAANLGVPVYEVPSTLAALGMLARYRRRVWGGAVVGVVGTNGKTSTKELLSAALGAAFNVHATVGNYNNRVGVPFTLLTVPNDADIAIVEMGTNHPGEVEALRVIAEPDVVVVTSIAEEHLEGLGDLEGVLREEMSACVGVPLVVTPASQPEIAEAARLLATETTTAGLDAGDLRPTGWGIEPDGQGWLQFDGCVVRVPLRGMHNMRNAMLALAVARASGVSLETAARGMASMPAPPMRVNFEAHGQLTVINDAYNSNPGSARAALELLEHAGVGRQKVAIIGSMLELGVHADRLHDEVARVALGGAIDLLVGVGDFAAAFQRVAPGDARVVVAADPVAAWGAVRSRVATDAVILLKGSRGVRLEQLVPLIHVQALG